jgi:hypothetical protein
VSARRLLALIAIASLAISAVVAILILLFGDFGETEWRVLGTTFSISAASLLVLPGAILVERGERTIVGLANVALAAAAFVLALALLWVWQDSETLARLLGSAAAAATASTQVAALTLRLRRDDSEAIRWTYVGACVLAAVLAVMAIVAIWAEVDAEAYYRILGALVVLDVFLVVLQSLLRRLGGPAGVRAARIIVDDGDHEAVADAVRRLEAAGLSVRVER